MRLTALQALSIAVTVAGLAGCQSSPRWAWWKPNEASSEDKSLLARSAAPSLPSTQSTPQVVESGSLQPVAPPSSANLAAAGTLPTTPAGSVPPISSVTVANAPLANYPSSNIRADIPAAVPSATATIPGTATGAAPSAAMPTSIGTSPQVAVTNAPATGPYDPNGYQPVTSSPAVPVVGQESPAPDRYSASTLDRYAAGPTNTPSASAASAVNRYEMPASTPVGVQAGGDRYGQTVQEGNAISSVPPSNSAVSSAAPLPSSSATVQLTAPAGKYRPGGTSSYVSGAAPPHVEVASRPSPAASPSAPAPSGESTGTSVPWAPPATGPPGTDPGVRTY